MAIVAFAVWGMARNLAATKEKATIAIVAAVLALSIETALAQVGIIALAGVVGWRLFLLPEGRSDNRFPVAIGRNLALAAWLLFFGLLVFVPLASAALSSQAVNTFDSFYRTGSLVFGGGHVVLPLIEREVVAPGWLTHDEFLAGYGTAQAVPGPLFTFSAYLGAVMAPEPNGMAGVGIALGAIFVPSSLLVIGGLPAWAMIRRHQSVLAALQGVNAAVVGLLLAALYRPVFTSSVDLSEDFSLVVVTFGLLAFWKLPPWLVVAFTMVGAIAIDSF